MNFSFNINFLNFSLYGLNRKNKGTIFQEKDKNGVLIFSRESKREAPIYTDFYILACILGISQKLLSTRFFVRYEDICNHLGIKYNGNSSQRIYDAIKKWHETRIFIKNFYLTKENYVTKNFRFIDSVKTGKGGIEVSLNDDFYKVNLTGFVKVIDLSMYQSKSPIVCRLWEILAPKLWNNNPVPLFFITVKKLGEKLGLSDLSPSHVYRTIFTTTPTKDSVAYLELKDLGKFTFVDSGMKENPVLIFAGTENALEAFKMAESDPRIAKYFKDVPTVLNSRDAISPKEISATPSTGSSFSPQETQEVVMVDTAKPAKPEPSPEVKKFLSEREELLAKADKFIEEYPELNSVNIRLIDTELLSQNLDSVMRAYEKQRSKVRNPASWFRDGLYKGRDVHEEAKAVNTNFYANHEPSAPETTLEKINAALAKAGRDWQQVNYDRVKPKFPPIGDWDRKEQIMFEILYDLVDISNGLVTAQEVTDYKEQAGWDGILELRWSI